MCVDSVSHNIDNSVWGLALMTACSQPAASSGFTRCQCLKSCTLSACLCPWSGCCMMFAWSSSEKSLGIMGVGGPRQQMHSPLPPSRTAPVSSPPEGRQHASCSRWEGLNRTIAGNLNHDPPVLLVFRELAVQLRGIHSVSVTDGRSQCSSLFGLGQQRFVKLVGLVSSGYGCLKSAAWWSDLQVLCENFKKKNTKQNCCNTNWATFWVKWMSL